MTSKRRRQPQWQPLFVQRLRWSRARRRTIVRRFLVVAGLAAFAAVVVLTDGWFLRRVLPDTLIDDPDGWCDGAAFSCNVTADVLGIVIGGAVVLVGYHVHWKRRTLRHYRAVAAVSPRDLFAAPPEPFEAEPAPSRLELARRIVRELRGSAVVRAHIVEGEAGAGKSTFMLLLAQQLVRAGAVPIGLSLRSRPADLDLEALACARFVNLVEDKVRSADEGARIWRELHREGAVVLLADGLDELALSSPAERDQAVRLVVDSARRHGLPCVFTTRPRTVPPAVDAAIQRLSPLSLEESLASMGVAPAGGNGEARLETLVQAADLGEVPLLLNGLRNLNENDSRYVGLLAAHVAGAPTHGRQARAALTRVAVLDRLLARQVTGEAGARQMPGLELLAGLEGVACALLRRNALALDRDELRLALDELPAEIRPDDQDVVLGAGERLHVLQLLGGAETLQVRFTQTIGQAHLTSRAIERSPEVLHHLLERASSPELGLATALSAARRRDTAHTRRLCRALLAARGRARPRRRLLLSAAAAQTATAGGDDALGGDIAAAATEDWPAAPRHARLTAIAALAELAGPEPVRALLGFTADRRDYPGRLAAAQAIMSQGVAAYDALEADPATAPSATLARAAKPGLHGEEGLEHRVAVLGWILPTWARTAGKRRAEIDVHIGTYMQLLDDPAVPPGVEASLAQGFKFAAQCEGPVGLGEGRALDLLLSSRFWYAKVVLLHAVTLRRLDGGYADPARLEATVDALASPQAHPFVRRAAKLSADILKAARRDIEGARQRANRCIWSDEAHAVFGDGSDLDDDAAELVADITVTTNLTEARGGADTYRSDTLRRAYLRDDLPACLSEPGGRQRLLAPEDETTAGGCCPHGLCPYPGSGGAVGRGELGESFCHHMAAIAEKRRPPTLRRRRPPWQADMPSHELIDFWRRMEARARD